MVKGVPDLHYGTSKSPHLKPYLNKYKGVTGDMYIDFKVKVIILRKNNHCEWFYFVSPNWISLRCEMINEDGYSFKNLQIKVKSNGNQLNNHFYKTTGPFGSLHIKQL